MTDAMIPYSFIPGTKAKAAEVNANFEALIDAVKNTTEVFNEEIENIKDTKADNSALSSELDSLSEVKADLDLENTDENIDYVIESWTSGANWYRKYRSGWVEQGGFIDNPVSHQNINLNIPFTDSNYTLTFGGYGAANGVPRADSKYPTYFVYSSANSANTSSDWEAKGKGV